MVVLVESGVISSNVKFPCLSELLVKSGARLAEHHRVCLVMREGNDHLLSFGCEGYGSDNGRFGGTSLAVVIVPLLNFLESS